jgi:phospholipid N-methyltransferase
MLGSIVPSSRFLVDLVLKPIDWGRARVIVEYGPGIGTFTGEILRRMRSDAQLVVIETNRDFVRFLQRTLPDLSPCAAADLRRCAAQFRATELPAGSAVLMHNRWGLKYEAQFPQVVAGDLVHPLF